MIWKYIVYWILNVQYIGGLEPQADEFGRICNTCAVPSVAVIHYKKEKHKKDFENRKDAYEFYNAAKQISKIKGPLTEISEIESVKIDSIIR